MPFGGMPKGEAAALCGMTYRKPCLFGVMPNGNTHVFGFVTDTMDSGSQGVANAARIMVDIGNGERCAKPYPAQYLGCQNQPT